MHRKCTENELEMRKRSDEQEQRKAAHQSSREEDADSTTDMGGVMEFAVERWWSSKFVWEAKRQK